MKQLTIISGKGGTGKTTVSASFAALAQDFGIADCDVEAPNLHLLIGGKLIEEEEFSGGRLAHIDPDRCVECGKCEEACRFGAIDGFAVNMFRCEGCGTCQVVCPNDAISITDEITGRCLVSAYNDTMFSHARLEPGGEGSGKLVTRVREKALEHCSGKKMIIIDGSPGIGCSVIASIAACDAALIVTEPTRSGLSDMERVLSVCRHFGVPGYVCINKYDINPEMAGEIEKYCKDKEYMVAGRIPYDEKVLDAVKQQKPVVEIKDSIAAKEIEKMFWEINNALTKEDEK